jgi:hypothetical protein
MIDAIEDAAVILLVATGSLAALSLAAWLVWAGRVRRDDRRRQARGAA